MTEELEMDRRGALRAAWTFVKRDLKIWSHFRLNFAMNLVSMVSQMAIYAFIAMPMTWTSESSFGTLNNAFVPYVVLGVIINTVLSENLTAPYESLMECFWNSRLEILMVSPISTPLFILFLSFGKQARSFVYGLLYVFLGLLVFGLQPNFDADYATALIFLALAMTVCVGLGLMGASMVYFLDAKGGEEPITWIITIVASVAAGVYYPVEILPYWLQVFASFVPQTYALDGIRRALFLWEPNTSSLPIHDILPVGPIIADLLILLVYCLTAFPIGLALLKRGIKKAQETGRLSRWA